METLNTYELEQIVNSKLSALTDEEKYEAFDYMSLMLFCNDKQLAFYGRFEIAWIGYKFFSNHKIKMLSYNQLENVLAFIYNMLEKDNYTMIAENRYTYSVEFSPEKDVYILVVHNQNNDRLELHETFSWHIDAKKACEIMNAYASSSSKMRENKILINSLLDQLKN